MQNTTAQRLDWIDAFKGICIIEIVLMHIHYMWEEGIMPEWILVPYFVPAFFFISGTFHKDRSIKEIIRQKSNTLLVPFVLWYALALILRLVTMMHSKGWDYIQQVWASDGAMAFKYQSIDGALWFLLALFEMCLFAKVLSYLKKKWLILAVSFPCAACGMLMMAKVLPRPDTYGIIPIAEVLWFQVFYILGMLWGKPVLNMIQREWNKTKIVYFGVALSFVFAVNLLPITESPLNLIPHMGWQAPAALCFIFCALQFCFWFSMHTPPHSLWIKILRLLLIDSSRYPYAPLLHVLPFRGVGQNNLLHVVYYLILHLTHSVLPPCRTISTGSFRAQAILLIP